MGLFSSNSAVNEVLSTIFLLMIATGVFASGSLVMFSSIDQSIDPDVPIVNIVGFMQGTVAVLEHRGGASLLLNTTELTLSLSTQNDDVSFTAALDHEYWVKDSTYSGTFWSIGQQFRYYFEADLLNPTDRIEAQIVDTTSKTVLFSGVLQTGFKDKQPLVETVAATDVSTNTATIHMRYDFYEFFGGSIRFRYKQQGDEYDWYDTNWIFVNSGSGTHFYPLTNLEENGVIYEFEACILYTDSSGQTITRYGSTKTFITLAELVGYWRFDSMDAHVAVDSSSYEHNGQVIGDVSLVVGKKNSAYQFSGSSSDYVDVRHDEHLEVTQGLSIAAWIKPDTDPDTGYKGQIKNVGESDITFDEQVFDTLSDCYDADIVSVSDSIYAIAYRTSENHARLMTVSVSDGSVVEILETKPLEIEVKVKHPNIVKVTDTLFAIAWAHQRLDSIIISTITISDGGIEEGSLYTYTISGLRYYELSKPVLVDSNIDYGGAGYMFLLGSGSTGQSSNDYSGAGAVLSIFITQSGEISEEDRHYLHAIQCSKVDVVRYDEARFLIVYAFRQEVSGGEGDVSYHDRGMVEIIGINKLGVLKVYDDYNFYIPYLAEPSMTQKAGEYSFMIAFGGYRSGYGFVYRVTIKPNEINPFQSHTVFLLGNIGDSVLQPVITYVGESIYVVTYGTSGGGYGVKTFVCTGDLSTARLIDCHTAVDTVLLSTVVSISEHRFLVLYSDSFYGFGEGRFVSFDVLTLDNLKNIISKGSCYQLKASDSQLFVYLNNEFIFSTPVTTNEWSFMVLTYLKSNQADNVQLYINAQKVAQETFVIGVSDVDDDICIGGFKGVIDELRLYATTIPQQVITTLYADIS
jgi:hypothetical protein